MPTTQTSVRFTDQTRRQIDELETAGWGTTTGIVATAIDRMYREEMNMKTWVEKQYPVGTTRIVPINSKGTQQTATVESHLLGDFNNDHVVGVRVKLADGTYQDIDAETLSWWDEEQETK